MPCEGHTKDEFIHQLRGELEERDAMLCAVLTVLESHGELERVSARIDWKEAGVEPHRLMQWWAYHMNEDAKRRETERRHAERRKLLESVRSKLTPQELEALGDIASQPRPLTIGGST